MPLHQKVIVSLFFMLTVVFLKVRSNSTFTVRKLTESNFDKTLKKYDFVLVMYYTHNNCEPCEKFMPDFEYGGEKAITDTPPVLFAKVNCGKSSNRRLCKGIRGIPALKFYKFGRYADEFKYRSREFMAKLVHRYVSPTLEEIPTVKHYLEYLKSTTYAVIGMFPKRCELKEAYKNVTNLLFEKFDFAITSRKEVLHYQNITKGIVVYKPHYMRNKYEEDFSVYSGEADIDKIREFILRNYHGIAGFRKVANKEEFSLPLVTVFYDFNFKENAAKSKYVRDILLPIADKYRTYVNFAISATFEWIEFLKRFGLTHPDDQTPIATAVDVHERKYMLTKKFDRDNLDDFVRHFVENKLEPVIRSGTAPSRNNGLIFEVVTRNLQEKVMGNDKDAILYIYDPNCHLCKIMDVQYEKLAEELKDEDIFFAKINGETNDIPTLIKQDGYPTIFFLQKHKKHKPIMYFGGSKLKELMKFVGRSSSAELKRFDREGKVRIAKKVEL